VKNKHSVDLFDHCGLYFLQIVESLSRGIGLPQGARVLPEFRRHLAGNHPGVGAALTFGLGRFGKTSILVHKVGEHVPLPAVLDRVLKKEVDQPAVRRFVQRLQNGLEKVIGLLELVPKGQVGLADLEVLAQFHGFNGDGAQRVATREEPATPAGLLRGRLVLGQVVAVNVVVAYNHVPVQSQLVGRRRAEGIQNDFVLRVGVKCLLALLNEIGRKRAVSALEFFGHTSILTSSGTDCARFG